MQFKEELISEQLKFNKQALVYADLFAFGYEDIDTKQQVIIIPSLQVVSYAPTLEEAQKFAEYQIDSLRKDLIGLPESKFWEELRSLGFEKNKFFNKRIEKSNMTFEDAMKMFDIPEGTKIKERAFEYELSAA